jgi:hypothetical protein
VLAAVTRSPGEMVIEDVSGPGRARTGHVIVRPERVGICGADFHLFSGDVAAHSGARDFYPRVQGHEVSAIVEDPGDSAAYQQGDRVAIWPVLPCGRCYPCRQGRPNVCSDFRLVGVHLDGGLQERRGGGRPGRGGRHVVREGARAAGRLPGKGNRRHRLELPDRRRFQPGDRPGRGQPRGHRQRVLAPFPLARTAEAFAFALSRPADAVKIVVTVN